METNKISEEEPPRSPGRTNRKGFTLLEEFDDVEAGQNRPPARRRPFQSSVNLMEARPSFRFKKLISLSYKWVLALTIVGHAFLGLFMGIIMKFCLFCSLCFLFLKVLIFGFLL